MSKSRSVRLDKKTEEVLVRVKDRLGVPKITAIRMAVLEKWDRKK